MKSSSGSEKFVVVLSHILTILGNFYISVVPVTLLIRPYLIINSVNKNAYFHYPASVIQLR